MNYSKGKKDWTGDTNSIFKNLGASNHTERERAAHDYYATEPIAADLICAVEKFEGGIWENCAGEGHLSKRLEELGHNVISTDLVDRGYGRGNVDFFRAIKHLLLTL